MLVSNLHQLAFGRTQPAFYSNLPETGAPIDRLAFLGRKGDSLYEEANAALSKIGSDEDLSDAGKQKSRVAVAKNSSTEIRRVQTESAVFIEQKVNEARKTVTPAERPSDARQAETRSMIEKLVNGDSIAMQLFINSSIERGDVESLDAILDAQAMWPVLRLIDDISALKIARIELKNAELGVDVADAIAANGELNVRFESMASELDVIANGKPDRTADIAAGRAEV